MYKSKALNHGIDDARFNHFKIKSHSYMLEIYEVKKEFSPKSEQRRSVSIDLLTD